jgi:hypothetical protein
MVEFYQELGFFAGQTAEQVVKQYETEMEGELEPKYSDDPELLMGDEEKTWSSPGVECIRPGADFYPEILRESAAITGGAFAPQNITEFWEGERGPIRLRFELAEHKIIVTPRWEGSQPDLHVLQQINCFVTDTGRQFECVGTGIRVVMWLTAEQKRVIQKVRRLEFWW